MPDKSVQTLPYFRRVWSKFIPYFSPKWLKIYFSLTVTVVTGAVIGFLMALLVEYLNQTTIASSPII